MGSSTGNLLVAEDDDIREIFTHSSRRIAVHCEDEFRLRERAHIAQEAGHPRAHPDWRDTESAIRATRRILRIAAETGHRVHVLHVTTAPEIELLAKHKQFATVEVTPQHLTLVAPDCYERLGTFAQMNPPIRSAIHREGLWKGIANGVVDVIGSDHAPHTKQEKDLPYPQSPSGMPGVQTLVPIMLNHVNNGKLTLERFVDLVCHGPARIYNIARKGRIAVGNDADFTIVDMKAKRTIRSEMMANKSGWTPFDGMEVTGWPMHTIIRGNHVMANDELLDRPVGARVEFQDTLQPKNILDETLQSG
jgi:dihydroorotase